MGFSWVDAYWATFVVVLEATYAILLSNSISTWEQSEDFRAVALFSMVRSVAPT